MTSDIHGRSFKKLRVSLTHECNYHCLYCSDNQSNSHSQTKNLQIKDGVIGKILPTAELIQMIQKLNTELHLETLRLTGGEPLLHPDLVSIVSAVKQMGIKIIAITTNGHYFFSKAEQLRNAGLDSVNISLDAVDEVTFKQISRHAGLSNVINSIDTAIELGLNVKINAVILKGQNSNQILPLLEFAQKRNIVIRFIELMAMGPLHNTQKELLFAMNDILSIIEEKYTIKPTIRESNATANYWNIDDKKAFGIIANTSEPFCTDCNRLRLDSYGNIFGCLSNLKARPLHKTIQKDELNETLAYAMQDKQSIHFIGNTKTMQSIGG